MTPDRPSPVSATVEDLLARAAAAEGADADRLLGEAVVAALPLADSLARRYRGRGIDLDDLQQVARLGALGAVARYRPGRGDGFAAYAVPTIDGEIKRHFRQHLWLVRPPRAVQELLLEVLGAQARLEAAGRPATVEGLAAELGADPDTVRTALASRSALDRPPLPELTYLAGEPYEEVLDRRAVAALVERLAPEERRLVRWRFADELSQADIAARLGVSQMQVSRELARLMRRLRRLVQESDAAG